MKSTPTRAKLMARTTWTWMPQSPVETLVLHSTTSFKDPLILRSTSLTTSLVLVFLIVTKLGSFITNISLEKLPGSVGDAGNPSSSSMTTEGTTPLISQEKWTEGPVIDSQVGTADIEP